MFDVVPRGGTLFLHNSSSVEGIRMHLSSLKRLRRGPDCISRHFVYLCLIRTRLVPFDHFDGNPVPWNSSPFPRGRRQGPSTRGRSSIRDLCNVLLSWLTGYIFVDWVSSFSCFLSRHSTLILLWKWEQFHIFDFSENLNRNDLGTFGLASFLPRFRTVWIAFFYLCS